MKKIIALSICALLGSVVGYFCAPIASVAMLQSTDPETFYGSSLALYKNTVVCDCNDRPPSESLQELSRYLSTLQTAKAKNQNSKVLSQEIGLTYVRLSKVEEKLNHQFQADEDMKHGQVELVSLGWKDVTESHLRSLVAQLDSEYKPVEHSGQVGVATAISTK